MNTLKLTGAGAAMALAAVLAGCGSAPAEPPVVNVTPPVVAVAPAAPATGTTMVPSGPTFRTEIGLAPLQGHDMRLQGFAGDVCVADNVGGGFMSHCICAGSDCTCQASGPSCKP